MPVIFPISTALLNAATALLFFLKLRAYLPKMAPNPDRTKILDEAKRLSTSNPQKAEGLYKQILSEEPGTGDAALRDYETALMGLGELYREQKKPNELAELVRTSRSTLSSFAKAKTAKIGELL